MAGGRSGPALFELLRDKTGTTGASQQQAASIPVAPARPRIEVALDVELPPPPPMPIAKPPPDPERPRAWVTERGSPAAADVRAPIPVTTYVIGLAVAGVLAVTFLVGALSYKAGYRNGEGDALKHVGVSGTTGVKDPLKNQPIPVNPNLVQQPTGRGSQPPAAPDTKKLAAGSPGPTGGAAATPVPQGTDPRYAGLNYYLIASKLDAELAERMVGFLGENGVQAFQVAKGGSGAKNAGSYNVYALPGITREQYRARGPERTELEEKLKRLGKAWQRDHKGGTDFATATWEKYGS